MNKKSKVLVLGGGLVGGPISLDLVKDEQLQVTLADFSKNNLEKAKDDRLLKIQVDLSKPHELKVLADDHDIIVNAVPGFMGFQTLKQCIESGKNVVDIAFYPEDVFTLSELALEKGVTVIADMGVAPGMSNLLTGYAASMLGKVNNVEIYVGGLPKIRQQPWEYKAVFSPTDVLEEYTRPARVVENGKIVIKKPLTEIEELEFDNIGTLEAFNSDGLRSILYTIDAPNMKEKTLRYPGYANKIKLLSDNGFFDNEEIEINGNSIKPIDLTSKLLFKHWSLNKGDADITVMRIIVEGEKNGKQLRYQYDLFDEYDPQSGVHSMARTTGYAASMAVRLLSGGFYSRPGITVPEMLGKKKDNVLFMLEGLRSRNINYIEKIVEL
jgi:lysine 6-dehydrogenase